MSWPLPEKNIENCKFSENSDSYLTLSFDSILSSNENELCLSKKGIELIMPKDKVRIKPNILQSVSVSIPFYLIKKSKKIILKMGFTSNDLK